jgi:uncharacterized protein
LTAKQKTGSEATAADWKFRQTAAHFSRNGFAISGAMMPELLARTIEDGTVVHDVRGSIAALQTSASERPGFVVSVQGRLGLACQSCGAAFELPVDSRSTIYVAKDSAELDAWEEESFESIEATEKTSALELVEDELLLAVPYVPRCEKCSADDKPKTREFN